jgi:hypothetical protein
VTSVLFRLLARVRPQVAVGWLIRWRYDSAQPARLPHGAFGACTSNGAHKTRAASTPAVERAAPRLGFVSTRTLFMSAPPRGGLSSTTGVSIRLRLRYRWCVCREIGVVRSRS